MQWFEILFNRLGTRVAVLDEDSEELARAMVIVRETYGPWHRVKAFCNYAELFKALKVSKAKKRPYKFVFVHEGKLDPGHFFLQKSDPEVKTIRYSDTQNLSKFLPAMR